MVHKVVLTGGPCGGKSSSLARLVENLGSMGFSCYAAPEIATILLGAGARPSGPLECRKAFQRGIVAVSVAMEDSLTALAAERDEPSVVLCDR